MKQERYDEAERLMLESLDALQGYDPPVSDKNLALARERLFTLYRLTRRPELIE
jgi:hypothetical protein